MADPTDSDPNRPNSHSNTCPRHATHRPSHEDENPFIAFRRYADEQISSLLQSVMGLPSTFSPPSTHGWLAFQNDPSAERYHQRHDRQQYGAQGEGQEQDHSNTSNHHDNYSNKSASSSRPRFDDFDIPCPHHHHSLPFSSIFFDSLHDGPWPVDPFPFSRSFFHPDSPFSDFTDSASWPVPYILFSSYSPLHLERQRQLRDRDGNGILSYVRSSLHISNEREEYREPPWRDAFEDLMRLENGKGMLDRDSRATAEKESGGDWLAGLMERGSLGDQWKPIRGTNGSRNGVFRFQRHGSPVHDAEKRHSIGDDKGESRKISPEDIDELESFTELDLYDDFLRQRNESSHRPDADEFTMSPLLRLIFAEQERRREELEEQRRQWKRFRESNSNSEQRVDNSTPTETANKGEVARYPTTQNESDGEQCFTAWRSANSNTNTDAEFLASANSPSSRPVTSTSTSTERKTLPDGSVQTKVVRSTRFADGTEESNETVDVVNSSRQDGGSQKLGDAGHPDTENDKAKKNSGWFWKE